MKAFKESGTNDKTISDAIDKFGLNCPECLGIKPLPPSLKFSNFDGNIEQLQKSLEKLEALSKQIQPISLIN